MFSPLAQTSLESPKTPLRCLKIPSRHLPALLLKTMKNVDYVVYPRHIKDAIPGSFVLITQFENASADRGQRPIVAWFLALLQLPKLEAQVLANADRKGVENLSGIAFPGNGRERSSFDLLTHRGGLQQDHGSQVYN
jgi:hypothetical protein